MKKKPLIIIGVGGHGQVAADIASQCGFSVISFLDDNPQAQGVIGKVFDYKKHIEEAVFFVAIGNSIIREKIQKELRACNAEVISLIHPKAVIGKDVKIGIGTVVMAGAVINVGAVIGDGVIINTCSSVDHDCVLEDFCHVSVGAHLCGTVTIGTHTWLGAGATVINNIDICGGCMIGAGAVVVKNIKEQGTYLGVPARMKP